MKLLLILLFNYLVWSPCTCIHGPANDEEYQLSGFMKQESLPVLFPKDICILKLDSAKFAATLHHNGNGQLEFLIFKHKNGSFTEVYSRLVPNAIDMDCIPMGSKGYIALSYNITETLQDITNGAPIFEITSREVAIVQFFPNLYQNQVYLRKHSFKLYLIHTYSKPEATGCPVYEWSGYHFNFMDSIPCDVESVIDAFHADHVSYVAVTSYERPEFAVCRLYKYQHNQKKFVQHQKFRIEAIGEIKHFYIESESNRKEHFLVMSSGLKKRTSSLNQDIGSPTVFYKLKNGVFVPMQQIYFHNVTEFLPVHTERDKFVLLVACKNQDMRFLRFNGQQFEMSSIRLTEGALAKGVTSMRTFEDGNETYVVIANERVSQDTPNIYLPLYKVKESQTNIKLEMLNRFNKLHQKLTQSSTAIKLKFIESALKKFNQGIGYYPKANISQATAKMIINPKHNMTKSQWKKLAVATKAIKVLEEKWKKILDMEKLQQNDTNRISNYDHLRLRTLTVTNRLQFNTLNNKSFNHSSQEKTDSFVASETQEMKNHTEASSAERLDEIFSNQTSRKKDFDEIHAKHIIVSGTINGLNFTEFADRILKNVGDQTITAVYNFTELRAKQLDIDGKINSESPAKLIAINGGNFVVDQDIVFKEPLEVNQLQINDRLNHINVVQGQLEVLLKESDQLQVITGKKTFEDVRLLEPFVLRGKIHSPQLDRINPVSIISQNITLEGNYEISGQVIVSNLLSATNFYGEKSTRNMLEVLANGLSVNTTEVYQIMNFRQPLETHHVGASFINNVNTRDFVKLTNNSEVIITGTKVVAGDLRISKGTFESDYVNDVNIQDLRENRLLKYEDQIINGHLEFDNVQVDKINSLVNLTFNQSINFTDILTTSTPQDLTNFHVENLQARKITAASLITKQSVLNNNLDYIIKDTLLAGQSADITAHKSFQGNLTAQKVFINKKLNHFTVEELVNLFMAANVDKPIEQNVVVDEDINIENIEFDGKLNGIPAKQFGHIWLQSEGDQIFTAPQIFEELNAKTVYIEKNINNYNLNEIIKNLYWLDQEELVPFMNFSEVIAEKDFNTDGLINGINFAKDILLQKSLATQVIQAPVTFEGNVLVTGQIKDIRIFNNIDLVKLNTILTENSSRAKVTVGSAVFQTYPDFKLLNGRNLDDIIKGIWFVNEDTKIRGEIEFKDSELQSLVELNGPLNDVELENLSKNYFSLTNDQNISTPIVFKGPVTFGKSLSIESLKLDGLLKDVTTQQVLNISDFASNALRKNSDQKITGEWKIFSAIVEGDLNNVRINGLTFLNDVVRADSPYTQNITAPKRFEKLSIIDLDCSEFATVNDVDMLDWIRNSALSYSNHTIQGTVTIDELTLYEGITVFGTVNGIRFDEKHLLLVDGEQTVHGNVVIKTKFEKLNRIMPLSVENFDVMRINNFDVDEFFKSLVTYQAVVALEGNLAFNATPNVQRFFSNRGLFNLHDPRVSPVRFVNQLIMDHSNLVGSFKEKAAFLSHYVWKNIFPGKVRKIIQMRSPKAIPEVPDVVAVLRGEDEQLFLTFHEWDRSKDFPNLQKDLFTWFAKNAIIIDCNKIRIQDADVLVIETYNQYLYTKHFITYTKPSLQQIFEMKSNESEKITSVVYKGQTCFLSNAKYAKELILNCVSLSPEGIISTSKEMVIHMKGITLQVVATKELWFAVLTSEGVEIWDLNTKLTPVSEIPVSRSIFLSIGRFDDDNYLAVADYDGNIDVFRLSGSLEYRHIQSIKANGYVLKVEFVTLGTSNDFLLYVLTRHSTAPFSGYVYGGILGFQKFLQPINIDEAGNFDLLSHEGDGRHYVAYEANERIRFLEPIMQIV